MFCQIMGQAEEKIRETLPEQGFGIVTEIATVDPIASICRLEKNQKDIFNVDFSHVARRLRCRFH